MGGKEQHAALHGSGVPEPFCAGSSYLSGSKLPHTAPYGCHAALKYKDTLVSLPCDPPSPSSVDDALLELYAAKSAATLFFRHKRLAASFSASSPFDLLLSSDEGIRPSKAHDGAPPAGNARLQGADVGDGGREGGFEGVDEAGELGGGTSRVRGEHRDRVYEGGSDEAAGSSEEVERLRRGLWRRFEGVVKGEPRQRGPSASSPC